MATEYRFKDLDLNFTSHPVRKDVTRLYDENAIIGSVKNLLFTNFYERPFQPNIGSNLRGMLFENMDNITAAKIERAVLETIRNHEPRVKVGKFVAKPDYDRNAYSCEMEFLIINRSDPLVVTFFLERVR